MFLQAQQIFIKRLNYLQLKKTKKWSYILHTQPNRLRVCAKWPGTTYFNHKSNYLQYVQLTKKSVDSAGNVPTTLLSKQPVEYKADTASAAERRHGMSIGCFFTNLFLMADLHL